QKFNRRDCTVNGWTVSVWTTSEGCGSGGEFEMLAECTFDDPTFKKAIGPARLKLAVYRDGSEEVIYQIERERAFIDGKDDQYLAHFVFRADDEDQPIFLTQVGDYKFQLELSMDGRTFRYEELQFRVARDKL